MAKNKKNNKKVGLARKTIHIFVDTNAIYTEDKKYLVNKAFESLVSDYKDKVALHIYLPNPVLHELHRQKTNGILSTKEKLRDFLNIFNQSLGFSISFENLNLSKDQISQLLLDRYKSYFNECDAPVKIIEIDYANVSMDEMFNLALSRKAPFEAHSDKGIIDYVIWKIIEEYLTKNKLKGTKYLICKDSRLKEAFKNIKSDQVNGLKIINDFELLQRELDKLIADVEQSWIDKINLIAQDGVVSHSADIRAQLDNKSNLEIFSISFLEDPKENLLMMPDFRISNRELNFEKTDFHSILEKKGEATVCSFMSEVNYLHKVSSHMTLSDLMRLDLMNTMYKPIELRTVDILYKFKIEWIGSVNKKLNSIDVEEIKSIYYTERHFLNSNFSFKEAYNESLNLPVKL